MPRVVPPIDGKTNNLSSSLIESTAGFTAGIVATLVVHPFDILKTRLQCLFPFPLVFTLQDPSSDKLQKWRLESHNGVTHHAFCVKSYARKAVMGLSIEELDPIWLVIPSVGHFTSYGKRTYLEMFRNNLTHD